MANYLSLDNLRLYDEKIKGYIGEADAEVLNSAKEHANSKDEAIAAAKKAGDDAAAAAAVADGKAVAAQNDVNDLRDYVGTFESSEADTVAGYIEAEVSKRATNETVNAIADRVTDAETNIGNIEKDYLKAADKTELDGKITETQGSVDTEKARAEAIEIALRTDINIVMEDYLTSDDKAELQGNIDTVSNAVEVLTDGVDPDKIDGVKDLINYVEKHGTDVTGMQEDISDNATAIEGVAGRVDTLEGEMDTVQGVVDTKADKSALEQAIADLESADSSLSEKVEALENKFGGAEGSVEDMIADAKAEAIETAGTNADTKDEAVLAAAKKYADDEDAKIESRVDALESASATHALASDVQAMGESVTALEGRVGANETAIGNLQTEMGTKASQTDLNAAVIRIGKNETDIAALQGSVNEIMPINSADIEALFPAKQQ